MTEEGGTTEERAKAYLRSQLAAIGDVDRAIGGGDPSFRNAIMAQNVLREETGFFGPFDGRYSFDQSTRDVLLAHGRQDAAHAMLNAGSLLQQTATMLRLLKLLAAVNLALLGLVAFLVLREFGG